MSRKREGYQARKGNNSRVFKVIRVQDAKLSPEDDKRATETYRRLVYRTVPPRARSFLGGGASMYLVPVPTAPGPRFLSLRRPSPLSPRNVVLGSEDLSGHILSYLPFSNLSRASAVQRSWQPLAKRELATQRQVFVDQLKSFLRELQRYAEQKSLCTGAKSG
jgi:hypothetical protein